MNPRRKKRLTIVSSIILGLGAVTALVLYALSQNIDLFYTPSEIIHGKSDSGLKPYIGQRIRVGGLVVAGTVKRDPDDLKVSFKLIDTGPMVTVRFDGILPDLFREGQGIVADGVLVSASVIEATEVLAKHDEEYMPKEVYDAINKEYQKPRTAESAESAEATE